MTAPASPPSITTPPAVPDRADRANFPTKMNAFQTWEAGAMVSDMQALAGNAYTNATAAKENADSASSSASSAGSSVTAAANQVTLAQAAEAAAEAAATTAINAPGTSATSTTSLSVGLGSKSLTIQTGKSIVVGMGLVIAYTTTPTTRMLGIVTSYDSGTGALVVDVKVTSGSGTYTAWTVSLSGGNVEEAATRGTDPTDSPTYAELGDMAYQNAAGIESMSVGQLLVEVSGVVAEVANGNAGASKTITWLTGNKQTVTLDQNTTLTFSFAGCPVGNYQLKITQDATGGRTVTWSTNTPGTTKWLGSVGAPSLNSAASGVTFASFYWDGTNCYGSMARVNAL